MATQRQLSFQDLAAQPRAPLRPPAGVWAGSAARGGLRVAVLPDAARVEEHLAALARAAPGGSGLVAGKVACSLAELERELVREARRAGKCPAAAPPHALQLVLRDAALSAPPPFSAIRHQPGFARALGDLLAALAQGLLEPDELLRLELPEAARARLVPLGRLLAQARRQLDEAGLVEPHRALRLGVDALAAGGALPPMLARAGELVFDGILDWTPLRIRLVAALAARLRVLVRLPWPSSRPELTEALEPTLRAFERLAAGPAPELELYEPTSPALAPFVDRLFAAPAEEKPPPSPVSLRSCATPAAQAREVARRCADLLAAGAAADSIAIAARSLGGGVAEEISAALDRLSLPWRERRGRPALPAPPVQLALSVLELVERDFPREPFAALLASRLLWLREEGERLPGQALAERLREAHVRDDASDGGVTARLDQLAARVAARAALEQRDAARDLAEIAETRVRAQRAIDALRELPERATLREHAAALLSLLQRWGLERHLHAAVQDDAAESALSRASAAALGRDQAALRALHEACAGVARAAAAVGLEGRPWSRLDWAQILSAALADASLPPGGARGGAIQLVELRELLGRSFKHVLVVGLVDGELPARPATDPLLSEEDRRAVNRAAGRPVFRTAEGGGESALLPSRQAEEPLVFHLALCSARESLALFWPRADAQGREALRSPFADEALRVLGLDAEERSPLAPIAEAAACRAPAELLARVALDAFTEPAWRVSAPADAAATAALAAAVAASPLAQRLARTARASLAERERLKAFVGDVAPGRFSGQLSGRALEAVLPQLRFGTEAPLSARQLEEHATCGFRTLGHRLLRVERDEEGEDDLAARERGQLLHRCLEAYFQRMRKERRLPLRGGAARESELATLREVAEAEMDAFARHEHVGHRALWELRRGEVHRSLAAVVDAEAEESSQPVELERRFGFPDDAASWEALRLVSPDGAGEVFVRGAIDRVDRLEGGGLVVLDYKSGRLPPLRRKLNRETLLAPEFQLSIYAALLRQRQPEARVDALYLSLKEAARTKTLREASGADVDALLETDPARRAELRSLSPPPANLADAVFARVREMRSGLFKVDPVNCDYCDLKPACRLVALPTDPDENGGEVSRG